MKRILPLLLVCAMLAGCGAANTTPTEPTGTPADLPAPTDSPIEYVSDTAEIPYKSRFSGETLIALSDGGITVNGGEETDAVYTAHDIVYYEDRDSYDSGNPYGEGEAHERHSADEAAAHTVVHITEPGAYRVSGQLSAGQIAIDLGDDAYEEPDAVVELILDGVDITCTVAPAIVFYNVYECDGKWSTDTAKAEVDTTAAGANLILAGGSQNTVSGSHVARIYKDKDGEKKLWKIDGCVYSFMSLNIYGPGALDITADNEGLNSELHLTINGGQLSIRSDNDGINTNEDGVSVTTINAGSLRIIAGLGEEGDGIDSNGYLVINGGTVVAAANPAADAGLDSDLGSYINGGTVIALGSTMDWAESDSDQVTMNLQFAQYQEGDSSILISAEDGSPVFFFDPGQDAVLSQNLRRFQGMILSCPALAVGDSYHLTLGSSLICTEEGNAYYTSYQGGTRMMYTGTDVMMHPGGFGGGFGGQRPDMGDFPEGERPTAPEGMEIPEDFDGQMPTMPEGFEGGPGGRENRGDRGEGERPTLPEGEPLPEGFGPGEGGFGGAFGGFPGGMSGQSPTGEGNTLFYMQDKVNFFSGLTAAAE